MAGSWGHPAGTLEFRRLRLAAACFFQWTNIRSQRLFLDPPFWGPVRLGRPNPDLTIP